MENKLQELTDKLYKEGLSKGKEEGEALLAQARAKAAEIVAEAKKKAESILAKAEKEAADLETKVRGDLKMASAQAIQATKKDIENLLVGLMTDTQVKESLTSAGFVQEIIKAVAAGFNAGEAADIRLVLPESLKSQMQPFIENTLSKSLSKGVEASFSKKISGGFTIGPKDGSYFISMTDETFRELISEYLRPTTKKLLFGE